MSSIVPPDLAQRIVWEAAAVRRHFPGRFRLILEPSGLPAWHGTVPVEGEDFPIILTYPATYPAMFPLLETTYPLPSACPHVLGRNGPRSVLCWIAPDGNSKRRRWDPQTHTAATVMGAGQRWALAFRVWQTLGIWPVPDAFED
jgi:hypothetical protein